MKGLGPLIIVLAFLAVVALACCYPGAFGTP